MESPAANADHASAATGRLSSSSPSRRMVSYTTLAPIATRSSTCFFSARVVMVLTSGGGGSGLACFFIMVGVSAQLCWCRRRCPTVALDTTESLPSTIGGKAFLVNCVEAHIAGDNLVG